MKACPTCGRLYADEAAFCQLDGASLVRRSRAAPPLHDGDPIVGKQIADRYLVFRVVADGAMGRVYEGVDTQLEKHVALKVLHRDVARDSVALARFRREWEVSRQIQHRHVVDVIDFIESGVHGHVLVMEFLIGEELRHVLGRERILAPERVVRIVSQLAIGLDAAHQHKLVHRDLKPENLFLCHTPQGDFVKVLDFGSVKDQRASVKQLTVMGTTIGSPYYMSPEQVQASPSLDQRADVWALAAVCYECLTGQVPFPGDNGPMILVNILTKPPRLPSEAAAVHGRLLSGSVDEALLRGLSKTLSGRPDSVGDFADLLGRAFGLSGDHMAWASAPEADLREEIARRQPELLAKGGSPRSEDAAAIDRFFGDFSVLASPESSASRSLEASVTPSMNPFRAHGPGRFWLWTAMGLGITLLLVLFFAGII